MLTSYVAVIGENIKRLREARGITNASEFARAIGVPPTRLNDWEKGRYQMPDLKTLLRIAKVLKVSIDQLVVGQDPTYDATVRDLTGHSIVVESAPHPIGGVHVPTTTREINDLRQRLSEYERLFNTVSHVVTDLGRAIAALDRPVDPAGQGMSSRGVERKRHRSGRKAG